MHLLVLLKTFLARHMVIAEFCDDCGRRVRLVWHAADEVFQLFNNGDSGGCLCPRCFTRRAKRQGCFLMWRPEIEYERKAQGEEGKNAY